MSKLTLSKDEKENRENITLSSLISFAIGDALGVPYEFEKREKLLKNPVTKMEEYGTHNVSIGTWSDDTSMTIATMDSIIKKGKIDYKNIMNNFLLWYTYEKYTATGVLFDIGNTTLDALERYSSKMYEPIKCGLNDIESNGNGSLMRMMPFAFYIYFKKLDNKKIVELISDASSLTHAHEISRLGCLIYTYYFLNILKGYDKVASFKMLKDEDYSAFGKESLEKYERILSGNLINLCINDVRSTGYVVDTLEASLWVILKSNSFKDAIIGAVNLGDDTDTIGAITGSLAGVIYGYECIPKRWITNLKRYKYLTSLANRFEESLKIAEEN